MSELMSGELARATYRFAPLLGDLHSGPSLFPNQGAFKFRQRPYDMKDEASGVADADHTLLTVQGMLRERWVSGRTLNLSTGFVDNSADGDFRWFPRSDEDLPCDLSSPALP